MSLAKLIKECEDAIMLWEENKSDKTVTALRMKKLLSIVKVQNEALHKIAKPALGGKQQQRIAQEAWERVEKEAVS